MVTTTRTQDLLKKASQYSMGTLGDIGGTIDVIVERGEGCYIWDTNGKKYLDICAVTQSLNLGYGRKEIHRAVAEQLAKVEFVCPFRGFTSDVQIEYQVALAQVTPKNIKRFIFGTSGTEPVELAIQFAKFYWGLKGKPTKYKVICLDKAYHGSSLMTSSLTYPPMRNYYGPEAPGVVRIPNYHCYRCAFGLTYPDCGIRCAHFLEHVIEQEGEDSVACFIAEPVIGAGGCIAPPPKYFPIISQICKNHSVLYVNDEVMTGFCRTGKMFAIEHWNVEADMMTIAKGIAATYIPMAGIGVSEEMYEVLKGTHFAHGHSFSGHPVACAAAKATLDIYIKEQIAEHVAEVGKYAKERLEKQFLPLSNVGDISGLGLLLGIGIVADKETKAEFPKELDVFGRLREQHLRAGLFGRFYGFVERLYFTPPLTITKEEIDKALDLIYPMVAGLKEIKVK